MNARPVRTRGFVFLETMVATIIIALALAATFSAVSQTARSARGAVEMREALLVARSALAMAGPAVPLQTGATSGVAGRFSWTLRVGARPGGGEAGPLMQVTAIVGTRERAEVVRLTTLRLPGAP